MNKNTILAVILSTLVVIGAFVFQSLTSPKKSNQLSSTSIEKTENSEISTENKNSEELKEKTLDEEKFSIQVIDENQAELEPFTIETEKAFITLTNKGGDIISYELKDHLENKKNKKGIQMADNITSSNRAFSVSFDGVKSSVLDNFFSVEKSSDEEKNIQQVSFKTKLNTEKGPVIFEKKYTFNNKDYMFKLDVSFFSENEGILINNNEIGYVLKSSPQIGPKFDSSNRYEYRQFITYNEKLKKKNIASGDFKEYNSEYLWNGIQGKYFAEFIYPDSNTKSNMKNSYYSGMQNSLIKENIDSQVVMVRKPISTLENQVTDSYYIYLGPRTEKDLKIYNVEDSNPWGLSKVRFNSVISSGWLGWLEVILKWIMEMIHFIIPNWGVSIILLTILLKLCLFPISKNQMMASLKMQEIQPKMQEIQQKYQNNPQKQQEMLAKLYKENGYNPMSGCLPMIFQFLILFAMYNLFNNYFEFRGAEFIPGWIDDLSVGDSILSFGFKIPFIGSDLRILPIIYLVSQLFYGKITNNGGVAGNSNTQMKIMMYGMPIIFFFLFYNAPSGLLLYWTVSNIFQMGQQIIINNMKQKHTGKVVNKVTKANSFRK
ncbi:MAG: membrane protein insertase YidC [Spirochaetia bacterium]|nr:membrane protein insertase YidC [Spirochaetia bacterium]